MRVTFDSNVWEHVVQPQSCANDEERKQALRVRTALGHGEMLGLFCEAWTTLEAVTKDERSGFLSGQTIIPLKVEALWKGEPTTMVMAGPDESRRPAMNEKFKSLLTDAVALGMRMMRSTRQTNVSLPLEYYDPQTEEIAYRTANVLHAIEDHGVGRAAIREFGLSLAASHPHVEPFSDIPNVPMTDADRKKISKLVAEWADGEAVACHIGYRNDVFCSFDKAGKTGQRRSILNEASRHWLAETCGVRFIPLAELAAGLPA